MKIVSVAQMRALEQAAFASGIAEAALQQRAGTVVAEEVAGLAAAINAHPAPHVVALDIPSGIDADTGAVPGEAVRADVTVTLGAVKQGLLRFPAAEYVGQIIARDIGIPAEAQHELAYDVLEPPRLAPRPLDAHKYHFGRV